MTDDLIKNLEISEKQAKDYGFYWPNSNEIMKQIRSECKEVEELLEVEEFLEVKEFLEVEELLR